MFPIFTKHENTLPWYLSVFKCLQTTCSSTFLPSLEILEINSVSEPMFKRIPVLPIVTFETFRCGFFVFLKFDSADMLLSLCWPMCN